MPRIVLHPVDFLPNKYRQIAGGSEASDVCAGNEHVEGYWQSHFLFQIVIKKSE